MCNRFLRADITARHDGINWRDSTISDGTKSMNRRSETANRSRDISARSDIPRLAHVAQTTNFYFTVNRNSRTDH